MMQTLLLRTIALGAIMVALGGCARSENARFYTLQSTATPTVGEAATGSKQITVVVGPIEIPEYLDRPQIVTRSGSHRLTLAEFDRWAEPVKQRFPRVLAENLAVLLATDRVVVAPWQSAASLDYRVAVDVIRFEGAPGGEVELVARWMVLGSEGDEIAPMKKSSLVVRANSPGYDGLAAAMSQAIADLSRHIAAAIRTAKCR